MDTSGITLDVHTHRSLKQGYLTKQPVVGGTFSSARRRFFVLTPVALEWYESETASAPKGLLPIEGARVEREGAGQNGGTLCITSGREQLVIHGDDLNGWETSLRVASGRVAAEIQAERKRVDAEVARARAAAEKADAEAAKARVAADKASRAARESADAEAAKARAAADEASRVARERAETEARKIVDDIRAGESAARAARELAEAEAAKAREAADKAKAELEAQLVAARAAAQEAADKVTAGREAEAAKARAAADAKAQKAIERADAEAAQARATASERLAAQERSFAEQMAQSERIRKTLQLVQRATRRESPRIKYYFVRADKLRATKAKTLPALQSLLENPKTRDWIVEKEMNLDDACRGKYAREYGAVSHRWLTEGTADPRRAPPDPKGVQLDAIKRYLAKHSEIKYVWVDWLCMWQADKEGQHEITVDEKAEFGRMLSEVNMLYLGCQVLVLLDLSYLTRFWTMYEAWLSRLQPTAQGLKLMDAEKATRCTIMPILGASDACKLALTGTFEEKMVTPQLAAAYLRNADVSVTNASDKEKQLAKLDGLEERVRDVLARDEALARVERALQVEPVDAAALRKAISAAEVMGVGDTTTIGVRDTSLEEARRVPKAMAGLSAASQDEVLRLTNLMLKEELDDLRGTVLVAIRSAGVHATVAKGTGYNLIELKAAGYVEGLKATGYTCEEVRAAGLRTSEAARAGYGADEARAAGFFATIVEARAVPVGYVEGLKAGGFSGLKKAGFTCEEAAGSSAPEAKQAGWSKGEGRRAGYTYEEGVAAGYKHDRDTWFGGDGIEW